LELVTANVSLHGMQIVCPIMRFGHIKADVRRGQLGAQVTLPQGTPIGATLSVRYCSQYGDDVLIGASVTLADPNTQAQWAAYIGGLAGALRITPEKAARSDDGASSQKIPSNVE